MMFWRWQWRTWCLLALVGVAVYWVTVVSDAVAQASMPQESGASVLGAFMGGVVLMAGPGVVWLVLVVALLHGYRTVRPRLQMRRCPSCGTVQQRPLPTCRECHARLAG
jgi:uncharacterized membrane protein